MSQEPDSVSTEAGPSAPLRWIVLACLFAVTWFAFEPARGHAFVSFDDPLYVTDNPNVRAGWTREGVTWAFESWRAGNWHPLTWLSHMADASFHGADDASGHHHTNILLHALTAVLLAAALSRLLGNFWPAVGAAVFFAVHPLRAESVAWVSERKDLLSGLFFAATLFLYAGYAHRGGWLRYALVLVAFAACLLSKAMGVTLPALLLLLDRWPLGRAPDTSWRRLLLEKVPLFAMSAGFSVVAFLAQARGGAIGSTELLGPLDRIANASQVVFLYVGDLLWPSGLCFFYPHPALVDPDYRALSLATLLAASGVIGVTLGLAFLRRAPQLLTGWLWYVGMLLPVVGIFQVGGQRMADRYTYLPSIGLLVAVAWSLHRFVGGASKGSGRRLRGGLVAGAALLLLVLSVRATRAQVETWRNSEVLYRHALAVSERNYVALNNLSILIEARGDYDEAEELLERALEFLPDVPETIVNYARFAQRRGNLTRAEELLRRALELDPEHPSARINLATVFAARNRLGAARDEPEGVLALHPNNVEALLALAAPFAAAFYDDPRMQSAFLAMAAVPVKTSM